MTEREADRARLGLLCQQAVTAMAFVGCREISPDFRRRLKERDAAPGLFAASELADMARTGLEVEVARSIALDQRLGSTDASSDALRRRAEGYAREQTSQLIADRHPYATAASKSFKRACSDAVPIAAPLILAGQPAPKADNSIKLSENLLVQSTSGASP